MRRIRPLFLAVLVSLVRWYDISLGASPATQSADIVTAVGDILRDMRNPVVARSDAYEKLRSLGPASSIIPLLATHLMDFHDGDNACGAMLHLDTDAAAPALLLSMPKSDRNVQYHSFVRLNQRVLAGHKVAYREAMHDAAVRCLEADTNADAAVEALRAIGLTGSDKDIPLLQKWHDNQHPTPLWQRRLRNAALGALIRVGSEPHTTELLAAFPAKAGQLKRDQAEALSEYIDLAGYTQDRRFTEPLLRCLQITAEPANTCVLIFPASNAATALDLIYRTDLPPEADVLSIGDAQAWQAWGSKPAAERGSPPVAIRSARQ